MHSTTLDNPTTLAEASALFRGGRGYLGACTMGLPSSDTIAATLIDAERWARGEATVGGYAETVERVRAGYAGLVGVGVDRVAIGAQASVFTGMVAAGLPDGAEVLCVDGDFSSMVFPFLGQEHRGVRVRHVPLAELAESVRPGTALVVFSLVQSASGAIADVAAIAAAARRHGARTLCDTTQAAGWMPVDAAAFDATICHSYKWLCAPRGVAFFTVSAAFQGELRPLHTGWYAGEDPLAACYGPTMELAASARRFDASPAWQAWVGAEPAIELFRRLDLAAVRDHAVGLADAFCTGLGIEPRGQAIVAWPDADGAALGALTAAGITASGRAGCARVAFHLWNDGDDVADALRALGR
ncbi:aminotransferase class V-fold PLP-dependent enzyme [Microterricola viridarii]|uniref:Selenocysteine lyase/Cysteine desulfurase n=1 Tax=Microterricola viridarii TaxID=412690 RepID=A0A1H1SMP6_9MICO|nr:aminotransferase class V-fold PLP-dependent enzyme [Microterricola viridarii]SDS48659.1 Selenocysteine lyase/Cysteine desulfurase [Microterricola viridarii]